MRHIFDFLAKKINFNVYCITIISNRIDIYRCHFTKVNYNGQSNPPKKIYCIYNMIGQLKSNTTKNYISVEKLNFIIKRCLVVEQIQ